MKRLTTAAIAVTLMCGGAAYAYAQDASQPAPSSQGQNSSPPSGTDQSGQAPQGPDNSGPAQPNTAPPSATPPDQGTAPSAPPASGSAPDASAGSVAGNTPDGQPPSSYPACTSRGQDRCVQSGHMASAHAKSHHHMKKPAA